jgi:hypothetical protein
MRLKRHASEILHQFGLNVSLGQRVSCLGVGSRQLVEIAKALSMEFRIMLDRVQSLVVADSGDSRRIQEAGRVDSAVETASQWESQAGQDRLPGGLNGGHWNKAVLDELVHLVFQRGRF